MLPISQKADSETDISKQYVLGINTCGQRKQEWAADIGLRCTHKEVPVTRSPEAGMTLQSCPKWNQGARAFYPCVDQYWIEADPGRGTTLSESVFFCKEMTAGTVQKLME